MKYRNGFVSNSSSSSFIIAKAGLTERQVDQIVNHATLGEAMGCEYAGSDSWSIEVTDTEVRGWTSMDNFDMRDFLNRVGVDANIKWDDGHFWDAPWEDGA